jgi:ATP phosphoribosyltransferase
MNRRIVIEGNDGTGKSTLVYTLRLLGFTNVIDRAEMSAATLDPTVQPAPDTTYILLVCDWQVSKARLELAGRDMTEVWHTDEALQKYNRAFGDLRETFDAHLVESVNPTQTMYETLDHLQVPVRLGMPSGRLGNKGARALGRPFFRSVDPGRHMFIDMGGLKQVFSRSKTYPQMVALGALDVAVVGNDALEGNPYADQVEVTERLPQVNPDGRAVRMVIAGLGGKIPTVPLLRVATPFPEWAQKVFGERGIPHTIFAVSGGTESLIHAGVADVIFDVVETGDTLAANRLKLIENVGTLDTCVIRRK